MVPLKYLSNFWTALEMPLINCEINPILTWSGNCVISKAAANQVTRININEKEQHKMLQTNIQNKLIDPSFQEVNRPFVLALNAIDNRIGHFLKIRHFLLTAKVEDYVMIHGKNFFDQPVKNYKKSYDDILKIRTGQEADYATGCCQITIIS